jgi:hypothetical protein
VVRSPLRLHREHVDELGFELGAAYSLLKAELSASAGVVGPNGPIMGRSVMEEAKISTFVPLLGLNSEFRLADRLSAGLIVNGIFAPTHPYSGSVFMAEARVDWFASRHFGFGGGFDYTRFHLKRKDTNSTVDFAYSYYGPKAYVIVTF